MVHAGNENSSMIHTNIEELAAPSQKLDQLGHKATGRYFIRMIWKGMKRLPRYRLGADRVRRLEM